MRYLFILIALFSFAGTYAVERPDGSIAVVEYFEGSKDTLEDVLRDSELSGLPVTKIERSDLPDRSDRKYWAINKSGVGKKVKVDVIKKQADLDAKAAKQAEKDAVLAKLKITKEEFEKLKLLKGSDV